MFTFLILFACAVAHAQDGPSVNTTEGLVVGTVVDGNYIAFYGIPYAASTSGVHRFKAPRPPHMYPGPFHALENNVQCSQPSPRGLIGEEDCLKLHVFTKNVTTPKPVIVWLQGEDFATWIVGPYSYKKIVESDVVFVSLNYRLSIFGFLCLGVPDAPGNAGLRDVIQGLKWIQANIAGFGGDPRNVVLSGHGSGAAMVDLITLSPLATGLVHKAIVVSGTALAPWAVAYDPVGHANAVGDKLGYSGKDRAELAKLLTTTELYVLGQAISDFEFTNNTVLFGPCIEDARLNPNDTLLADAPINILRSGNYNDVPYIGMHTDREGSIRAEHAAYHRWLERMQENFTNFLQVDLNLDSNGNKTAIVNSIREFYFALRQINMETIEDFLDYIGDTSIVIPAVRNVRERALTAKSEVRLLEFAYRGTYNSYWPYKQIPLTGVKHGEILNYIFDFDLMHNDMIVSNTLIRRIAAFAYTGNPNPQDGSLTDWFPVEPRNPGALFYSGSYVGINESIFSETFKLNLNKEEIDFWNNLYSNHYVPPSPVSSAGRLMYLTFSIILGQFIIYLI